MAKYKFTLSPYLQSFVNGIIEYYPDNKKQLALLKDSMISSAISQYGPRIGSSFDSEQRPTEDITIMRNQTYIVEQERIILAVESVLTKLSEQDLELVRLRYWSGELTPDGIAMKLNIDRATMYYRLNNIQVEVARRLGLVNI